MTQNDEAERPAYLICKYGGYYRPNCQGYTDSAIQAGRYTMAEAEKFTHPNGPDGPRDGMHYVHEDEVKCDDLKAYRTQAARIAELEAANRGLVRLSEAQSKMLDSEEDRAEAAEADVARLREALTLIERLYYIEDKDAGWRASRMNGVAREAQDGNDLGHYRRIFPRAALQPKQED